MNIKLITKAMHTLSLLSEEDVAMVMKLRGLSEDERQMLMLVLEPQKPGQKKSSERVIEHCADCDYTRRAKVHKDATVSGYHEFQPSSKKPAGKSGSGKGDQCVAPLPNMNGKICGALRDNPIHEPGQTASYHQFQSSKKSARASGMAQQLNKQLDGRRQEQTEPIIADNSEHCQFMSPAGGRCGGTRDDNQHHLYTRADYHQFVAPPAAHAEKSDAQSAAGGS